MRRRVQRRPTACCDDIRGPLRDRIIAEHLCWLEHRHLEQPRDLSEYPLATWLAEHRGKMARARSERVSYYRNTKVPRKR